MLLIVYWKYSVEDGPFSEFPLVLETDNQYTGLFPQLSHDSSIQYYIKAENTNGRQISHPNAGWHTFQTLSFNQGDLNNDSSINILDAIQIISEILNQPY